MHHDLKELFGSGTGLSKALRPILVEQERLLIDFASKENAHVAAWQLADCDYAFGFWCRLLYLLDDDFIRCGRSSFTFSRVCNANCDLVGLLLGCWAGRGCGRAWQRSSDRLCP